MTAHIPKYHNVRFKLDIAFYIELISRLDAVRNRLNQAFSKTAPYPYSLKRLLINGDFYPSDSIPSEAKLASLIETAFWASLQREEGRSLRFVVKYHSPSNRPYEMLALDCLSFNVNSLVKLAPAVNCSHSAIVVAPEDHDNLKIVGIAVSTTIPLEVKALDPGLLIVSYLGTNVAVISGNEAVFIRDSLLSQSSSIWSIFNQSDDSEYSTFNDYRVGVVLDIVRQMRLLGHGGTLIVVPDDEKWKESVNLPIPYSNNKESDLLSLKLKNLKESVQDGVPNVQYPYLNEDLSKLIETFGCLTAVDGAVILTRNLDLIGFGAKLKAENNALQLSKIFSIDPLDHSEWVTIEGLEKLGGMRHQSAARFVSAQQNAIAFVVSQDGHVTAFVWEKLKHPLPPDSLFAYKRLELTLF